MFALIQLWVVFGAVGRDEGRGAGGRDEGRVASGRDRGRGASGRDVGRGTGALVEDVGGCGWTGCVVSE